MVMTSLISAIRSASMRASCAAVVTDHTLTYHLQCSMLAHAGVPINAVPARHAGYGHR
jgi:hypothetical protein